MKKYLVIILFAIVSCENPSDCKERYFSDKFKSYVYFNQGSYWIYEDTILGIIDSSSLTSHSVNFDPGCSVQSPPQENLNQKFTSSHFKGIDNYNWEASAMALNNVYVGSLYLGSYSDLEGNFIDSILIRGTWYKDVIEFSSGGQNFFRAKGIGLIRKEFKTMNSGDTLFKFDLIRYHLN